MGDRSLPFSSPNLSEMVFLRIRRAAAAATVICSVTSGAFVVLDTVPASAAYGPTINFAGHGQGHGRGMGQYGAYGYALQGKDKTWLLDHFYGGTHTGAAVTNDVKRVRLTKMDNVPTTVVQDKGMLLSSVTGTTQYSALRATPNSANPPGVDLTYTLESSDGCYGTWTLISASVLGPIEFSTAASNDTTAETDASKLVSVCEADVANATSYQRYYRGTIFTAKDSVGPARTVNAVPIESYLRGVIPRESIASWGVPQTINGKVVSGMAELEANAVAARAYVIGEKNHYSYANTCDTDSCQVYGGVAIKARTLGGVPTVIEHPATDAAVVATIGEVRRMPDESIAYMEFHSSTGGYSAGGTFPAVVDDGDATPSNPVHNWQRSMATDTFMAKFPGIGSLVSIDVTGNGLGADGGRTLSVKVVGTKGSTSVAGWSFRNMMGFPSDWFRVTSATIVTPVVAMAAQPTATGYWISSADGSAYGFGGAPYFGSLAGVALAKPIVGIAATTSGAGYWMLGGDGGVFSFGDAVFYGSTGNITLNKPVVAIAVTPTGKGYWFVASDGGVFAYGDAQFYGSMGAVKLNKPVVGMTATRSGHGYWLVASDGGIFAFGDAQFYGSMGGVTINQPVVGMAASNTGNGYWMVASDGGIFSFGDAPYYGSKGGTPLPAPVQSMTVTPAGDGYWFASSDSIIYAFGNAKVS